MKRVFLFSILAFAAFSFVACSSSGTDSNAADECLEDPNLPICQGAPMPENPTDDPMPDDLF